MKYKNELYVYCFTKCKKKFHGSERFNLSSFNILKLNQLILFYRMQSKADCGKISPRKHSARLGF